MFRFLWALIILLALAAGVAAGISLYRSDDPVYTFQEWLYQPRFHQYDPLIRSIAKKYEVDPNLVKAIVWRESGFHAGKIGKNGERGLMQVTEGAATEWVRARRIENFVPTDLLDPKTNIEAGTWYLKQALTRWSAKDDPVPFALAEYNAGRTRVERWITQSNTGDRTTAGDLRDSIAFPGTRSYVETILQRYNFYKDRGFL